MGIALMAESPAHRFGQLIGDLLEIAVEPHLSAFAKRHGLFLDRKGPRPARLGNKVTWIDSNGNKHDLDFVLERGGTSAKIGVPVAFIETAWRRYTKHSRNKAQEIQGAILPLFAKYRHSAPFIGVVLAGVFTGGALTQLKSQGFAVLYIPYESVVAALALVGIDADCGESTTDREFAEKMNQWEALSHRSKSRVPAAFIEFNKEITAEFFRQLELSVTRQVELVRVLALRGGVWEVPTIREAIELIQAPPATRSSDTTVDRYEIVLRYGNGDEIKGDFNSAEMAVEFLMGFDLPAEPATA